MRRFAPFLIIALVLIAAVSAGVLLFGSKQRQVAVAMTTRQSPSAVKPGAQPPHIRNALSAKVKIEEFGDFECPSCAALSPALKQATQKYKTDVCLVFRHFPISAHGHARQAARACEAAGLQERFWEMYDLLYGSQLVWTRAADTGEIFIRFAQSLGMDLERFKIDMESDQVKTRIAADQQRGVSLGVDRTPTILIDDHRLPATSLNQESLRQAIDSAVKQTNR